MINMLIGQPGGGKSYEAVAFHVLPALAKGRKVITNLPLDLAAFAAIDPAFPSLIVLRHDNTEKEVEQIKWNLFHRKFDKHIIKQTFRPFSFIGDYADLWRHPKEGFGPLYVIDECHLCLPRARPGTAKEVEEWFSLHRHELADVLLITQSYGKVCKAICDMVQVLYRVKKATAFGTNNRYIRKVQDGIGGEVVNTSIRSYEKQFFSLYKSHTKTSEAGSELAANDIVPFWKRWPMIGAAACFLLVALMMIFSDVKTNPIAQAQAKSQSLLHQKKEGVEAPKDVSAPAAITQQSQAPAMPVSGVLVLNPLNELPSVSSRTISQVTGSAAKHPFDGLRLHIIGFLQGEKRFYYVFEADQNGQPVSVLNQNQLEESGYKIEKLSSCSAKIIYEEHSFFAVCDSPRIQAVRSES